MQLHFSPQTRASSGLSDLLFVQNLTDSQHKRFVETRLNSYFTNLYHDLAQRSSQPWCQATQTIDKNTFADYINLPGVISDRFCALAVKDSPNERITLPNFLALMYSVYSSQLEQKMELVFDIFDCD